MDTTQGSNSIEQANQDSFEAYEQRKSENILSAFFSDCNEEEMKIINDLSQNFGIRTNDALWIFVKVFFSFNRENNKLPQRITNALDSKRTKLLTALNNLPLLVLKLKLKRH